MIILIFFSLLYLSYHITSKFQKESQSEHAKKFLEIHRYDYTPDEKTLTIIARSFYPLKRNNTERENNHNLYFPCFPGENNQNKKGADLKGLIYVKIHKSSSSTLAGINLRIAHRHGSSAGKACAAHYEHKTAKQLKLSNRDVTKTFLWTFVRQPQSLSISRLFFFDVTRGKLILNNTTKSDDHVIQHLKRKKDDNVSFKYLDPFSSDLNTLKKIPHNIKRVINTYDFIGIADERFDESLVALRLLLGLSASDIIYVRSKVGGSYDNAFDRHSCIKTAPSFVTESMKKYYSSQDFYSKHKSDFLLYSAVNRSLDLTIEKIGISRFQIALKEHKYLMSLVDKMCAPVAKFPCSIEGKHQAKLAKKNCYKYDYGCGYPCLDKLHENVS